jgi:hypothetical protein
MKDLCRIELRLKEKLELDNNGTLFANYQLIRDYLFKNIYPEIGGKLPNFTYHDGSHVIDVLENIYLLLDDKTNAVTSETLYFLCLSALFHDVGLVYDRDEHQRKIGEIYNSSHGNNNLHVFGNEKIIISKSVEAHSGKTVHNNNDTLEYLGELSGYSEMINIKDIAAMLKFADELAEGGQRTSDYFLDKGMYPKNNIIFHRYSQAYSSVISPKDNRLAITYNVTFYLNDFNDLIIDPEIKLIDFLDFVYKRIIKLDDERKYCKYYCRWLDSMKEISIKFNFWYNGDHIEIGLNPLVISDKVIPGDFERNIEKLNKDYNNNYIIEELQKIIEIKGKELSI